MERLPSWGRGESSGLELARSLDNGSSDREAALIFQNDWLLLAAIGSRR